jgi:sugar/nucleoside kinase (ribokinase family)
MPSSPPERPSDLLVAGHVNVDRFLRVDQFPAADRTVPVVTSRAELGGTAANIARVASGYGVPTGLVARLGDGFPAEFSEVLRKARIDLRGIEFVPGRSTPTCYIVEDSRGGQRTLIDQGSMEDDRGPYRRLPPLTDYSWLHLTTGPPAAHRALARRARAAGVRVAVDPAQEIHYRWSASGFRQLLGEAEVLFGNGSEMLKAQDLAGVDSPEELLALVPLIVRTEGAHGATAFSRSGTVHVPAPRPRRSRTIVGAGDAFRGGFYAAWFAGQPLEGTLVAGVRAATRWIEGVR